MRLIVANQGKEPLQFEEALHTYFAVGDAKTVEVFGLADTEFIDKTDGLQRKRQSEDGLHLSSETDRLYLNTDARVELADSSGKREISIEKSNSMSTVVWNPWSELSAKMADMTADNWQVMTCIETVNAADNAVVLAPGTAHSMETYVSVKVNE
jgi:glucose-6-phosphate 1-epimerase